MANVNIPQNPDNGAERPALSSQAQNKRRRQKSYQEALAYERAFLKKKEELTRSATTRQLRVEIRALQEQADKDIALAKNMIRDKEALETELAKIRTNLASELSQRQLKLISEQRKSEYAAHEFAVACAMKAFQSQNVHQRAHTAEVLADEQRIQTEKLRNIKTAEIAELEAQKAATSSAEEQERISSQIADLRNEIAAAEAQESRYQKQAVEYAEIVRRVDFSRLSAAEKLAKKEQELLNMRAEGESALAEIDSSIEARKIDLTAARDQGDTTEEERILSELAALESKREETTASYSASVESLRDSIEREGGFREQAMQALGTRVQRSSTSETFQPVETTSAETLDTTQTATDIPLQISLILNCLTNFVSAFETYVDTLDSRVANNSADTSSVASQGAVSALQAGSIGLVGYLRNLVDQSATNDIELQTQLYDRIDRLSNVISNNSDIDFSTLIEPLAAVNNAATLNNFLEDLSGMISSSSEEDEEDYVPLDRRSVSRSTTDDLMKFIANQQRHQDETWYNQRIENEAELLKLRNLISSGGGAARANFALDIAMKALQSALDMMADVCNKIDENINSYFQYQATINARLQGTELTYQKMLKTMTGNLGMSMLVSQREYIEEFKKLVDAGIAHNAETRAFLATVSDKVVNTFNAFDANLLKLIRIQQNDSTAARLGLESSLNTLFNSYFSDTSYLNDVHDSVSGAILEASSMLTKDMSLEFEYMIHKWLGSLYSLGVSEDTLQSIAQGLNYLGTGNVTALNGNEALQTLLAMSANRGGESYADILVNGLNADTTNNLLRGMIEYLMEIATNTESSQVTKSAYSDLFGLHISDLRAIINLTEGDIESLANLTMTYSQAVEETQNQLSSIISRTHVSQMVDMLFDNAVLGASLDIGKNPVTYGLWKTLNLVEELTGGIALPFVNVFGSGFDLNTTVTQLAKSGIAGLTLLGNLVSALGSGGLNTGMDINEWNNVEMTSRGSADKFLATGTTSGFSTSTRLDYAGSGSAEDLKLTEMSDASDQAAEDQEIINKNQQENEDVPVQTRDNTAGIWAALAEDGDTAYKQLVESNEHLAKLETLLLNVGGLNNLLSPTRVFLSRDVDSGMLAGLQVQSGSVTSELNMTAQDIAMNSIKSAFVNIAESNADLLTTNIDIWGLIDSVGDSSLRGSLTNKLNSQYNRNSAFYNFNGDAVNKTSNTALISAIQTEIGKNVILEQQLKDYAQIQQLNKIVFPEYVRATIDDLAPGVKKYSEELIKRAVEMSLFGTDNPAQYEDEQTTHPVVQQLKAWLSDPSTVLRVERSSFY